MRKNTLPDKTLRYCCICLLVLNVLFFVIPTYSATTTRPVHVLMLYSWHKDMPWQLAFEKGFRQDLAAARQQVRLYVEYLDIGRFPEVNQQEALSNYLQVKYSSTRLDLIIAESDPAVTFFKKYPTLFPGVRKILFQTDCRSGVSITGAEKKNWLISIVTDFDKSLTETLRLINPDQLFVIADTTDSSGARRLSAFKETLERKAQGLHTEFLINLPLNDLVKKVARLPDRSAIFYLLLFQDEHGQPLTPFQAAQRLSQWANAPIVSHWESLMGSGILGGYLLSGERIGHLAARSVVAHSAGKPFTFRPEEAYGHYYDWQQLASWGIDKKKLAADTVLLNSPPGIWEYYKWQIVSIVISLFVALLIFFLCYRNKMIKKVNQELNHLSATDSLTGLLNRRAITPLIAKEMNRKNRFDHPVTFLILDIDHFKNVNDQYGHYAGDEVLARVAGTMEAFTRNTDNIARWGGEEFVILASNTGIRQGFILAEKIRKAIMAISFHHKETITVSIGAAEYRSHESFQQWYERADSALYKAKNKGRNRVVTDQCMLATLLPVESGLRAVWKEDFYSGHPVIDKQHIELIAQTNHLIDAILTDADAHAVETVLDTLFFSLKEHFAYEEQVLEQIEYPQLQRHRDDHLTLLTKSARLIDQYRDGAIDLVIVIKFISQDVVAGHLDSADKDYFTWLNPPSHKAYPLNISGLSPHSSA